MKKLHSRLGKTFIRTLAAILIVVALVIVFISPLTKYLLEKHDVSLINREISMDWAYVNVFTGYVYLSNLKIYAEKGDSVFLAVNSASASFSLPKLLNQTVEITQLTIDHPVGKIVQKKDSLNFDDIIRKFTPDSTDTEPSKWHVTLLKTKIIEGEFHYIEKIIPINYFIRNVNVESDGKERYVDTISAKFSFRNGKHPGDMKGDFTINVKNADYRLAVKVNDFDLEIIRQYIWELINYGMFRARLDADIHARGNFNSSDSITARGDLRLRDFHLGQTTEYDYLAFENLAVSIQELSPPRKKFLFDSITLTKPLFVYEVYDSLDNIQTLFGRKGSNITDVTQQPGRFNLVIEIARYIKILARNFFSSDYRIDKLAILDGDFRFNDYSLAEKFTVDAAPLSIRADSINSHRKRVGITFTTGIKPYGEGSLFVSINPKDSGDFDMKYNFSKIPATAFNPYLISLTSFPVDRGTLEVNGVWNVRNGDISSYNHLIVMDPRVTKRIRNKATRWIPLPIIMAFVRDKGNVIDYEVPITGSLKDPKFHLRDVIHDIVTNIVVKPATTPYRMEVKSVEKAIEKSLTLKWEMRQYNLTDPQERFVKKISGFLEDNPAAELNVRPIQYTQKEKEYILFFETKKKYFLIAHHKKASDFSEQDSLEVSKMSVKDDNLIKYISRNLSDTVMFTLQEKCMNFVGNDLVSKRFKELTRKREAEFMTYFRENGTDKRVRMYPSVNSIPFGGFSFFSLTYPTEIPPALRRAYDKMNELNDEGPRKRYLELRKKEEALMTKAARDGK